MQQTPQNSLMIWKLAHSTKEVTVSCKPGPDSAGLCIYTKLATHSSSELDHASPGPEGWPHKQKQCKVTSNGKVRILS